MIVSHVVWRRGNFKFVEIRQLNASKSATTSAV